MINADSTIVTGNHLFAYGTASVIGMRRAGTNGATHGGYVHDNIINALGQSRKGVYDECNTQPSYVGPNDIRNNGAALRVDDQTGGKRLGYSRRVTFSGVTASAAATNSVDTTVTLPDSIQTTGRIVNVYLTGASVVFFNLPICVVGVIGAAAETSMAFRAYNAHSVAQTFNYAGSVEGD
jgi:hypothetical protein